MTRGPNFVAAVAVVSCACWASIARAQDLSIEVVEQAVAAAEARAEPEQRWAFTRTITLNGETLTARFDPSKPTSAQWTLLVPAREDELNDAQSDLLRGLREEPVSDRLLMIEAPHESYGVRHYVRDGLVLSEESETEKRYAFEPRDDVGLTFPPLPGSPRLSGEVLGELLIATSEPTLAGVRIYAEESFKPNPAARIDALDISWRLGEAEAGGPIVILTSETRIAGRAAFREFGTDRATINSDFVRVVVPDTPTME